MKKLVTADTILATAAKHETIFPIDANTLITPEARDEARRRKIQFVDAAEAAAMQAEAPAAPATEACPACGASLDSKKAAIIAAVIRALNDRGVLDEILSN